MLDPLNTICIDAKDLDALFKALKNMGYALIGPRIKQDAITYAEIDSSKDLPQGWGEDQDAGTYRLKQTGNKGYFGFNNGPHSWKQFLFPPRARLWKGSKTRTGFRIQPEEDDSPPLAFIGARACDLQAIAVQDKIFMKDDTLYKKRREQAFILAVNCGQAAKTCFCTSTNSGPKVTAGFDLALTEICTDQAHYFTVQIGSDKGKELMDQIDCRPATKDDLAAADERIQRAEKEMGRTVDLSDIKELLYNNYDNARWAELEKRCLSCGNCTMVCPTCFCSKTEDVTDLTGDHAERWREWDSCFSMDHSYIHGGHVRPSIKSRYRQWLMHKLATWWDQFGSSGCVGCGRCIAWCPVGIDLTEEVKAIRNSDKSGSTT